MSRPRASRDRTVARESGAALAGNAEAAEALKLRLLNALEELEHRIRAGEKPPQYLLDAVLRFADGERDRYLRSAVIGAVEEAAEAGHPLSRDGSRDKAGAYEFVAQRFSRAMGKDLSARWVESIWKAKAKN